MKAIRNRLKAIWMEIQMSLRNKPANEVTRERGYYVTRGKCGTLEDPAKPSEPPAPQKAPAKVIRFPERTPLPNPAPPAAAPKRPGDLVVFPSRGKTMTVLYLPALLKNTSGDGHSL